ncbi:MAG: ISKra4 family transposase, partial [Verrucomicrobiota bacterium]|nr:ISKra4 family transposase [Verrucomicrobiota bacterium]
SEISYFQTNASRMLYRTYRRNGYFIGSGVVEAGCKTVIGQRAKQSGMFWTVSGAENVLSLRCLAMDNALDQFWQQRKIA